MKRVAHCLCGAVGFRAEITDPNIQACHCQQCQRWTGGGPLLVVTVRDVEVTGDDAIRIYRASDHGERAFCANCGSTLFWKMTDREIHDLPVGLFTDQSGLKVGEEIFVDYRPDWLPHFAGAAQSDEAQELAKLRAYLDKQGQQAQREEDE